MKVLISLAIVVLLSVSAPTLCAVDNTSPDKDKNEQAADNGSSAQDRQMLSYPPGSDPPPGQTCKKECVRFECCEREFDPIDQPVGKKECCVEYMERCE